MREKGFAISLDAVIALGLAFIFFAAVSYYFSFPESSSFRSLKLKEASFDLGAVLEKSGQLESAVKDNKTIELRRILNKTPNNLCFQLKVFSPASSNPVLSVRKSGCPAKYSELTSIKRSFVVLENNDANFYWGEVNAWNRE